MNIYFILKKADSVIAIDIYDTNLNEIIDSLVKQGYEIVCDNQRAIDKATAIKYWQPKPLTPLERANETIRKANYRVNELKEKINSLELENKNLKVECSVVTELELINKSLKSKIATLELENKKLHKIASKNSGKMPDSINILGFDRKPGKNEVKEKYRKLCVIYHPDKGGSAVMMQLINDAYDNLKKLY